MRELYREYYATYATQFDAVRLDGQAEIELFADICCAAVKMCPGVVADVGSGTGRYARELEKRGLEVLRIDASEAQHAEDPSAAERLCARAEAIPLRTGSVSACAFVMSLHQLSPSGRGEALSEAARVTRIGGALVIKTASPEDLRRRQFGEFFPSALSINIARYPTIESLEAHASSSGFAVELVIATETRETVNTQRVLGSFKRMHNTTLALLDEGERERGILALAHHLSGKRDVTIRQFHTLVVCRRESVLTDHGSETVRGHG